MFKKNKNIKKASATCTLMILLQHSSPNATAIWRLNSVNTQRPAFLEGQISYYTTDTYQITLDLLTLGGHGYLVLDDFTFRTGMCQGQFHQH